MGVINPESSTAGTALLDSSSILSVWAVSVPDPLSTNDPSRSCGAKIPPENKPGAVNNVGVCRMGPDSHTQCGSLVDRSSGSNNLHPRGAEDGGRHTPILGPILQSPGPPVVISSGKLKTYSVEASPVRSGVYA